MRVRFNSRAGFTLLELLVVMSIIALIMALLMPSLRQAHEQAKQVACRKNLSDLWNGVLAYSTENNDRVPFIERISETIDPYDPKYPTLVGNVLGPYVNPGTFVCPAAVAGYPDRDPHARRKWKLTYDFATADRTGRPVPYDKDQFAYTGKWPDPAAANDLYFDGRPLRMITMERDLPDPTQTTPGRPGGDSGRPGRDSGRSGGGDEPDGGSEATVVWTMSVPLIADRLGEERPGDIEAGRPRYPHRGVVRRQQAVYRALARSGDPRVITSRRPGYFQLHAEGEHKNVFLTRYSPDAIPEDGD